VKRLRHEQCSQPRNIDRAAHGTRRGLAETTPPLRRTGNIIRINNAGEYYETFTNEGIPGTTVAYSEAGYETSPRASSVAPEVEPVLMAAMKQLLGSKE
jgi:hypothetical protein